VFPVAPVPSGLARARGVPAVSVNDISAGSEFASASHYASRSSFSPINSRPPGQIIIVVQFPFSECSESFRFRLVCQESSSRDVDPAPSVAVIIIDIRSDISSGRMTR